MTKVTTLELKVSNGRSETGIKIDNSTQFKHLIVTDSDFEKELSLTLSVDEGRLDINGFILEGFTLELFKQFISQTE